MDCEEAVQALESQVQQDRKSNNDQFTTMNQEIKRIEFILIGDRGRNGVRGDMKNLSESVADFTRNFQEYMYKGRRDTCYGAELVATLRAELDKKEKEKEANMALEKQFQLTMLAMANDMKKARRTNLVTIFVALITLAGVFVGKIV